MPVQPNAAAALSLTNPCRPYSQAPSSEDAATIISDIAAACCMGIPAM